MPINDKTFHDCPCVNCAQLGTLTLRAASGKFNLV